MFFQSELARILTSKNLKLPQSLNQFHYISLQRESSVYLPLTFAFVFVRRMIPKSLLYTHTRFPQTASTKTHSHQFGIMIKYVLKRPLAVPLGALKFPSSVLLFQLKLVVLCLNAETLHPPHPLWFSPLKPCSSILFF